MLNKILKCKITHYNAVQYNIIRIEASKSNKRRECSNTEGLSLILRWDDLGSSHTAEIKREKGRSFDLARSLISSLGYVVLFLFWDRYPELEHELFNSQCTTWCSDVEYWQQKNHQKSQRMCSRDIYMLYWGIGDRWTVGLEDHEGLFQPRWFYDSMTGATTAALP